MCLRGPARAHHWCMIERSAQVGCYLCICLRVIGRSLEDIGHVKSSRTKRGVFSRKPSFRQQQLPGHPRNPSDLSAFKRHVPSVTLRGKANGQAVGARHWLSSKGCSCGGPGVQLGSACIWFASLWLPQGLLTLIWLVHQIVSFLDLIPSSAARHAVDAFLPYMVSHSIDVWCIQEFHAAPDNPVVRVKARWDREETVLMAREELRLQARGVSNINQELLKSVRGRSLEAIKSHHRSMSYRELRQVSDQV